MTVTISSFSNDEIEEDNISQEKNETKHDPKEIVVSLVEVGWSTNYIIVTHTNSEYCDDITYDQR